MPSICYFQIDSPQPEKTKVFYQGLFGWDIKKKEGVPYDYWEFPTTRIGGPFNMLEAGLVCSQGEKLSGQGGSSFIVYFDTKDIDVSLAKVNELGGTVVINKTGVPEQGYMAICKDDQGAQFGLWQEDTTATGSLKPEEC